MSQQTWLESPHCSVPLLWECVLFVRGVKGWKSLNHNPNSYVFWASPPPLQVYIPSNSVCKNVSIHLLKPVFFLLENLQRLPIAFGSHSPILYTHAISRMKDFHNLSVTQCLISSYYGGLLGEGWGGVLSLTITLFWLLNSFCVMVLVCQQVPIAKWLPSYWHIPLLRNKMTPQIG